MRSKRCAVQNQGITLRGRGHLFAVANVLFILLFISIKWPANYLSTKYLELNFFTYYTVYAKRPKKLVKDVLHFFLYIINLKKYMGWKCA